MKLDFNNIDEVFKDGLEDYTEQPSGNVWKNISGKMFWYDLLHLRFGNIPKAWLGAVAGILIMAVLIGIWAIPGSDETTVLFEDTGVKASQDGLQNAQPEITSDQAKQSVINVEIVESVDKSANQQPATNSIKSPLANDQGQESLKADQPEMEILTIPSTTAETMGIQNVSPDIQSSDQLSGGKSGTSEVNEYQMTEVAGIRATATNPGQGSDANRTASEKPGKMQDEVSFGVATEISDNRIGPENDPSSFENESAVEGVRKTGSADTELENLIEINQAMGAMKKMPKPGGISFNTVQPVHYGRRPAKRNYQYPQD